MSFSTTRSSTLKAAAMATATATAMDVRRIAPHPPDLIRWVTLHGGFVHPNLKLSDRLSSSAPIPAGSQLLALPHHLPLRLRFSDDAPDPNDRHDSPLSHLIRRVPEELWAMKLGLKLLQERAKLDSFWWPYVGNLPETFTTPVFFSGEEIKNLQYAPLLHQVNKRCRFLYDFDKEVKDILKDVPLEIHPFRGQDADASSLGWAMSAVSSRAFRLHDTGVENSMDANVPMMLPLIDMCNHSFQPNARIIQQQESSDKNMLIQVIAGTSIPPNVGVTLNYGHLSNDLFLLDYGFVMLPNPYDCVELRYDSSLLDAASHAAGVSCSTFSSPTKWQENILSQLNLHGDGALLKVTLGGSELVDRRLLAALRVLLASDMDAVQKQSLDTLMSLSSEAPLGLPVETAALRTLIALCAITLQYFPTKIMEDETILKAEVSSSMELAVQFRMQKKSLIIDVMRELSKRIRPLSPDKSK